MIDLYQMVSTEERLETANPEAYASPKSVVKADRNKMGDRSRSD